MEFGLGLLVGVLALLLVRVFILKSSIQAAPTVGPVPEVVPEPTPIPVAVQMRVLPVVTGQDRLAVRHRPTA